MRLNALAGLALAALASAGVITEQPARVVKRQSSDPPTSGDPTTTPTTTPTETPTTTPTTTPTPLPLLQLDYATYRAASYDETADIYLFQNIRYAAAPTGNLRWKKPQAPKKISGIQDGSLGFVCSQQPGMNFSWPMSEDCLFLDIYVPGKAARDPSGHSLPVVAWVHGGTNNRGSKDQSSPWWWDGTGPIQTSNNSLIFVSFNYRLGPLGWLSGDSMEKQGLPNAGLHDQRAALKWIQKYISGVGGDKTKVTAWGVSAGASDLVQHLVAQGGTLDPLFSKAFLQSPGSMVYPDRLGYNENCTQNFIKFAKCNSIACIRGVSPQVILDAQAAWDAQDDNCGGIASDGTYLRQPAAIEFATGNYWKNLESLIIENTNAEPDLFLPDPLFTDADFRSYMTSEFPSYAESVVNSTMLRYPTPSNSTAYADQNRRAAAWIVDFIFASRMRSFVTAYPGKVWVSRYTIPVRQNTNASYHASDIIPLFWNYKVAATGIKVTPWLGYIIPSYIGRLSATYQSYMTSHAVTGDPNTNANATSAPDYPAVDWPKPGNVTSQYLTGVLNWGPLRVSTITDPDMLYGAMGYATSVTVAITNLGGYAVPGAVMSAKLPSNPPNPKKPYYVYSATAAASKNYKDQCKECREA